MADAHFDRELQLFLRDLEEIQPFYTESIKDAKDQLVETFFDHLMHYEYQYEDSPEIQAQRRAHLLRVMAERDFPHYESYFQGRVQVSNVPVVLCAEGDDIVFHRAGSEDVFQGVFEGYCIESIPTPDQLERFFVSDDEPRNQWGLSMILTDPQYIDGAGMEHAIAEYIIVPLTYPDTHPRRVIETSQVTTNAQQERILQAMHDVTDLFHDSSTQAVFTDIENDLNYNNYRDEALQVARMEYQDSIDRTQGFTEGATVQLVCTSVLREQGGTTACMGEVVTYVRPTLIYASTMWRVAHRFSRTTNEGGEETLYALPEYIEAAYVQAEV